MTQSRQAVAFSGGKDSTGMLLAMLDHGEAIDIAVFFDSGWEFPALIRHIDRVERDTGVHIQRISPRVPWSELMCSHPVRRGRTGDVHRRGYGWPAWGRRWCSRDKSSHLRRLSASLGGSWTWCIGIGVDEKCRAEKVARTDAHNRLVSSSKRYPLIEYGMSTSDAMSLCRSRGYDWEGLYEDFSRVSCFCCPMKRVREWQALKWKYPELWRRMLDMDARIDGFSGFNKTESLVHLDARLSKMGNPWDDADPNLFQLRS